MDKKEYETLRKRYDETKTRISQLRKEGSDVLIPSLRMMNLPSKFMLLETTQDDNLLLSMNNMLSIIRDELSEKSPADKIKELLQRMNSLFTDNKTRELKAVYERVRMMYGALQPQERLEVLTEVQSFFQKIEEYKKNKT